MTISRIIKSFRRRGYRVTRSYNGVSVIDSRGFFRLFPSYRAAYLHYQILH